MGTKEKQQVIVETKRKGRSRKEKKKKNKRRDDAEQESRHRERKEKKPLDPDSAATMIQRTWRGGAMRSQLGVEKKQPLLKGQEKKKKKKSKRKKKKEKKHRKHASRGLDLDPESAATLIQRTWRGGAVRNKMG